MAESTWEQITRLITPDDADIVAAADFATRRLFNRSLQTLCDERDAFNNPLTPSEFSALVKAGRLEAALAKDRATANTPPAEAEMPATI